MLKTFATLAVVAIATLPAPAAAKNVWYSATTAQGCTIDWWTNGDVYSQATFERDVRFRWSGNCPRGGVASGRGRLSQDFTAGNAGGTPPQHWTFDGTLVDGVIHGDATVTFSQEGQLIWSRSISHNMGCVAAACVPRAASSSARAASSSGGGGTAATFTKGRIIARDGRHALACVTLIDMASRNSSTTGGSRVLSNQCGGPVEVGWCSMSGECQRDSGNMWTIQAGKSWPVDRENEIRWGACHGKNTFHGEAGSKGLRFTCSKPN